MLIFTYKYTILMSNKHKLSLIQQQFIKIKGDDRRKCSYYRWAVKHRLFFLIFLIQK